MSSIQSKPWDDKGWGSLFKRDFTSVATYGNNRSTRIVLISGQATIDREYVETTLKQNEQMNKITFQVMDILEENMCDINGLVLTDQENFVRKLKMKIPTVLLLPYYWSDGKKLSFMQKKKNDD